MMVSPAEAFCTSSEDTLPTKMTVHCRNCIRANIENNVNFNKNTIAQKTAYAAANEAETSVNIIGDGLVEIEIKPKCEADFRVDANNTCVACPSNAVNAEGDDPNGTETFCKCPENYFVNDSQECEARASSSNKIRASGDPVPSSTGQTTVCVDCAPGYEMNDDGVTCDPTECGASQHVVEHTCTNCGANSIEKVTLDTTASQNTDCECATGYTPDGSTCVPAPYGNACPGQCDEGTGGCQMDTCEGGWCKVVSNDEHVCGCGENAEFKDNKCKCDTGYRAGSTDAHGNQHNCTEIDECVEGTDTCGLNATCTNESGHYGCACNAGYFGDGKECQLSCTVHEDCKDSDQDFVCDNGSCRPPTGAVGTVRRLDEHLTTYMPKCCPN